eukprot:Hpha_TRINITY_DN16088_c7_g5::TRINITY_DN16088_c7_g5_i1::g.121584::m.121584
MGLLENRLLVRDGDTPDELRIKKIIFPFALVDFVLTLFVVVVTLQSTAPTIYINFLGLCTSLFAMFLFIIGVLVNAFRAGRLLDVVLGLLTLSIIALDIAHVASSYQFRGWAFIVLVVDMALVFKRDQVVPTIIFVTLLYNVLVQVQSVQRFGLYELGYWGASVEISQCNCASPPCGLSPLPAFIIMVGFFAIFLLDFYLTHGFASGM